MDPDKCYNAFIHSESPEEAISFAEDLIEWLDKGGCEPEWKLTFGKESLYTWIGEYRKYN